jgi:hypothetical protein
VATYGATTTYQYQDINGVSVTPQMGPSAGGTTVTVTNTNSGFIFGTDLQCQFGLNSGNTVTATFVSNSSLTCSTLAGTNGQTITIQVTNNQNDFFPTSATASTNFIYNNIAVSSIAPNSGTSNGGTSVTVTGTGFLTGYTPQCEFGTIIVTATINSGTQATCTAPTGSGTVAFQFTNNGQNFVSGGNYTYTSGINITSLSPNNGKSSGFTVVTVIGTGFINSANLCCEFGSTATSATYINATAISCSSAPGTNGQMVNVGVSNNCVNFTGALPYQYQNLAISATSPSNGKSVGDTILTITGSTFISGNIQCEFALGSTQSFAVATFVSSTSVTVASPAFTNGAQVSLTCTNNLFDFSNALNYRFQDIHTTSVTPTSGAKNGGTTITIDTSPQNIVLIGSTVECRFGSTNGNPTSAGSSIASASFNCATPSGLSGQTPEIFVTNNGVDWFDTGSTFAFNDGYKAIQYSALLIISAIVAIFIL